MASGPGGLLPPPEEGRTRVTRKPTMADVAARAGVTVATVSRALRDDTASELRGETVARIRAVAGELGYSPNTLARSLRTRRSMLVGMLVSDVTNPFMAALIRAIERALQREGYALVSANTDNDPARQRRSLNSLVSYQVDGLLVASTLTSDEELPLAVLDAIPTVLVNRRGATHLPAVVPDDAGGVRLIVDHLTRLGHRRLAHVAGPSNTSTGQGRAEAFAQHLTEAGSYDPALVEHVADLSVEEGHAACERLLSEHPDVTAVFAANDLLAIGCLRAARDRGLRVPADLSVVGFNDMPLLDLLDPPLTSVRISGEQMGQRAAGLLLASLRGAWPPTEAEQVEIPGVLVRRASTARPRRAA